MKPIFKTHVEGGPSKRHMEPLLAAMNAEEHALGIPGVQNVYSLLLVLSAGALHLVLSSTDGVNEPAPDLC